MSSFSSLALEEINCGTAVRWIRFSELYAQCHPPITAHYYTDREKERLAEKKSKAEY